jgi:hypothetical protein
VMFAAQPSDDPGSGVSAQIGEGGAGNAGPEVWTSRTPLPTREAIAGRLPSGGGHIGRVGVGMGRQGQAYTDQKHRTKHPLDRQDLRPHIETATQRTGTATSNTAPYRYRWCLGVSMLWQVRQRLDGAALTRPDRSTRCDRGTLSRYAAVNSDAQSPVHSALSGDLRLVMVLGNLLGIY